MVSQRHALRPVRPRAALPRAGKFRAARDPCSNSRPRELAKRQGLDLVICDGSPGVGCPVISSLSGANLAVAVVEPTPSGRHDFERIAALCDHFRIPVAVLINKADLNHEEVQAITRLADDRGYTVVGALPFDPAVTGAMIRRKALTETDSPLASTLSAIWGRIRELAYAPRKQRLIRPAAAAFANTLTNRSQSNEHVYSRYPFRTSRWP